MAQVLILKSSILGAYSQSNALIDVIAKNATETNVVIRDLAENPLPILDHNVLSAFGGGEDLTEEQQNILATSNQLIEEIKQADKLIIAAPMYNFTVPTQLKNWIDLIARAGVTFQYSENGPEGLLTNVKETTVITTRGGVHKDTENDIVTSYLKTTLGFVGIHNVNFVYAEALSMGEELASQELTNAKEQLPTL
ncbi:NAD(P)H-dependent oxidoreductase [Vibrio penaeicida]|uniref:FMN dependent NADH:quinone oxidoreductase n=1 Tax=Vibrio penaeicida TaxID=104609 RepID=A0AAV5NX07_9VIBR|nr:NAD(P)H-dependent oxidoreductase [Vibrio penaeicida]RTZ18779.1 FMN-dependent NADH-azoreductase [Vibrio penaeicida]GLQ74798.1 FMN-dependent NADH-azoreductase [Vibrio penaeicida]